MDVNLSNVDIPSIKLILNECSDAINDNNLHISLYNFFLELRYSRHVSHVES